MSYTIQSSSQRGENLTLKFYGFQDESGSWKYCLYFVPLSFNNISAKHAYNKFSRFIFVTFATVGAYWGSFRTTLWEEHLDLRERKKQETGNSRRVKLTEHKGDERMHITVWSVHLKKKPHLKSRRRWEYNIKMGLINTMRLDSSGSRWGPLTGF